MSNSKQIVTLIAKGQDQMSPMMGTITKVTAGLTAAAIALAATVVKLSKEMAAYGAELFNGASATGMSIEGYQALNYTLEQTAGITNGAAGATRAMNTFMRTAATGSAEYTKVLDQLGLKYDDLVQQSPEDAFLTITDALGNVDDAMQRNIATTTVFGGRYSQQIVAALDQAGGSLRGMMDSFSESGRAMSTEQVTALKAYDDALTDVNYEMKKLGAEVIVPLIPLLMDLIEQFRAVGQDAMPDLVEGSMAAVQILGDLFKLAFDGIESVGGVENAIRALVAGFIALKVTLIAHNAALGTAGILFIKTPALMAGVKTAATTLKGAIGPAGLGLAIAFTVDQLMKLQEAMKDAKSATESLQEAEERLGESQRALQILFVDMEKAITEGDIPALIQMRKELDEQKFFDRAEEVGTLTEALHGMSLETVASTMAMYDLAIANAENMAAMMGGLGVMDSFIAKLREQRQAVADIGTEIVASNNQITVTAAVTGSTAMGSAGEDEEQAELDRLQRIHDKRTELEREYKQMRLDAQIAYDEAVKDMINSHAQAEMEGIRAKREANLQAAEAQMEAQEVLNQQAMDSLVKWSGDFMVAMASGKDAARAWGEAMVSQIIRIVSQQAFSMLFALITGGASTGVGGIFGGILGFSAGSGGAPIPHASAGLQVTPGNPGLQTDNRLAMVKSDEMILSRGQTAMELEKLSQGGGNTYIYQDHSLINTADSASMARAMALLDDLDRKRGTS